MDTLIKKTQTLSPLEDSQREAKETMEKLKSVSQGFQKKLTDYEVLISMMIAYFKNFEEVCYRFILFLDIKVLGSNILIYFKILINVL